MFVPSVCTLLCDTVCMYSDMHYLTVFYSMPVLRGSGVEERPGLREGTCVSPPDLD